MKKSPIALDRLSLEEQSLVELEYDSESGDSDNCSLSFSDDLAENLIDDDLLSSTGEPTIVCRRKLDDTEETRTFTPLEFLAEVSSHVPNIWEQTTRYLGVFAV